MHEPKIKPKTVWRDLDIGDVIQKGDRILSPDLKWQEWISEPRELDWRFPPAQRQVFPQDYGLPPTSEFVSEKGLKAEEKAHRLTVELELLRRAGIRLIGGWRSSKALIMQAAADIAEVDREDGCPGQSETIQIFTREVERFLEYGDTLHDLASKHIFAPEGDLWKKCRELADLLPLPVNKDRL